VSTDSISIPARLELLRQSNSRWLSRPRNTGFDDPNRSAALTLDLLGLHQDASRLALDEAALAALLEYAAACNLRGAIAALFAGQSVNRSEDRPALHMALRDPAGEVGLAPAAAAEVRRVRERMLDLAAHLRRGRLPAGGEVRHVLHLGIGGSDLGVRLLGRALPAPAAELPEIHFLNVPDPDQWRALRDRLDPRHTVVIVASKSFTTAETRLIADAVLDWLGALRSERAFAVTAAPEAAATQGYAAANTLPLWPWVGGRYSLWSAVGLAAAVAIGPDAFRQLLAGAAAMDRHFATAAPAENLPLRLALYDFWQHRIQGHRARGVYVYDPRLALLPDWLVQLEMESLGKSVDQRGAALTDPAVPLVHGGSGLALQHALYQALHQGVWRWPVELLGVAAGADAGRGILAGSDELHLASMLAQAQAFCRGAAHADPARALAGGIPVSLWLLDKLDPHTLGALLAAYEHKVFALGVLHGVNPFDQWGVETGKRLARDLLDPARRAAAADPQTHRLLRRLGWL